MNDKPKYIFTHKVGDKIIGKRSQHPYKIIEDCGNTMIFKSEINGHTRLAAKIFHANTFLFLVPEK